MTEPIREKDLPATRGMLALVRDELKFDIRGVKSEMREGFERVDARFERLESGLRSDMSQLESRLHSEIVQLESRIHSDMARLGVLIEQQNANNQIVLEGLTSLWQRQERIESQLPIQIERAISAFFAAK